MVTTIAAEAPVEFRLEKNYPNPFNPATVIPLAVTNAGPVKLVVYDAVGREVIALVDEELTPGTYHATWDGRSADGDEVPSGIYFYRMTAGSFSTTRSMVVLR